MTRPDNSYLSAAIEASRRMPPLWPLDSFVAVNPFLGLADRTIGQADRLLRQVGGRRVLPEAGTYREDIQSGRITDVDLQVAIAESGASLTPDAVRCAVTGAPDGMARVPRVSAVLAERDDGRWTELAVGHIAKWIASRLGDSAGWSFPWQDGGLYSAWRTAACHDRGPEIAGLYGFRKVVAELPSAADEVIATVPATLGIPATLAADYFHALLLDLPGWAGSLRQRGWKSELAGGEVDQSVRELLAIRLGWEKALHAAHPDAAFRQAWSDAVARAAAMSTDDGASVEAVLLAAREHAVRRELLGAIAGRTATAAKTGKRPTVQAVFCIDVRSEVFRRHLEAADPNVQTLGFAGFFGLPVRHVRLGEEEGQDQCPVLIDPRATIYERLQDGSAPDGASLAALRRLRSRLDSAWSGVKNAAASCFPLVEIVGLGYAAKLAGAATGIMSPFQAPESAFLGSKARRLAPTLSTDAGRTQIATLTDMAEGALRGMSLVDGFAPLVLLCGHESATVNNPHRAGLDCGACGGHSGAANARVAADLLNNREVRQALRVRGIVVPDDTVFVAGVHDTTRDRVRLLSDGHPQASATAVEYLKSLLEQAGAGARAERAPRLGLSAGRPHRRIFRKANNWSEVRPEWGLAGNAAFIAARRSLTRGANLAGRSFLHEYDASLDPSRKVLELILTAPVVVASWINLQYFASTADPEGFGAGNKVLHNVTGLRGVVSGNGGDLMTGLPLQSVHDGTRFVHEPVRLNVFIEAPEQDMDAIIGRHPGLARLIENRWILLFSLSENGTPRQRRGEGHWETISLQAA